MGGILLVDDDVDIREALSVALEIEGYPVLSASNGLEAWNLLGSGALPGLIVLDLMMPVMNGAELLERIRSDERLHDLPVVVVSAFGSRFPTVAQQAQACLGKPVDLEELMRLVNRYCAAMS